MFSYLQMPFLQALGYAIANSLWQLFLLWLMVIVVNGVAGQSSHVKYVTALCAQIGGFVWFLATFQFYYRHCLAASFQAEELLLKHDVVYTQTVVNYNVLSYLIKAEETLPYLSIAYLFLLLILLVKWIKNFQYTRRLGTLGLQSAERSWQAFVNETADRLGIIQDVTVYVSAIAKSPLTIGYIKPIILLPLASINQLSTQQLEAVLLHELAHIKRADYMINLLVSLVEIILFFNPFTRLLSSLIKKERENCCDDWVLQFQYDAAAYAEALLRIAYTQKNNFGMNAASGKKGELLQRVKRIVQPAEKSFNYKHQVIALFLITGLLFSIAWLQPVANNYNRKQESNIKEIKQKIVITPLTAQVDNPFFSAASLFSKSMQADVSQSLADIDKTISDSIAVASLQIAQKALDEAAPAITKPVSSGNWQKIMQKAKEGTGKSLQNIDWKALQNEVPQMPDSSFIMQSVADALQLKTDDANVKEGLASASEQLAKLKNEKAGVSFGKELLQQITASAFAAVKKIDFKAIQDSVAKSTSVINKLLSEQKTEWQETKKKQLEWIRKARDDFRKKKEASIQNLPLPPPPPPATTGLIFNNDDGAVSNLTSSASSWQFSEPVFHVNANNNSAKTIRIVTNNDSSSINIIIEIKQ